MTWTKHNLVIPTPLPSHFCPNVQILFTYQKTNNVQILFFFFSSPPLWSGGRRKSVSEMSKLLFVHSSHLTTIPIHRQTLTAILSSSSKPLLSTLPFSLCYSQHQHFSLRPHHRLSFSPPSSASLLQRIRNLSARAFDDSSLSEVKIEDKEGVRKLANNDEEPSSSSGSTKGSGENYPTGEFEFEKVSGWKSFVVKLRMLIAFPWERVRKGSVLTMKLRGQVFFLFFSSKFWFFIL